MDFVGFVGRRNPSKILTYVTVAEGWCVTIVLRADHMVFFVINVNPEKNV